MEPTDMEVALFLATHLDHPCGCEVNGRWQNIRPFYKKLAIEAIKKMTNPFAVKFLKRKVERK